MARLTNQDTLHLLSFSAKELKALPAIHASFLVASCLAVTEITTVLRLVMMALSTRRRGAADDELKRYINSQLLILERLLSAKAFEYLNMLASHQKQSNRRHDSLGIAFHARHDVALKAIRADDSFGVAKWLRDKVTSHYNVAELAAPLYAIPDDQLLSVTLHTQDGNSLYLLGEEIAVLGRLNAEGNGLEKLEAWRAWTLETCRVLISIHHDYMLGLMGKYYPDRKVVPKQVFPEDHLVGIVQETPLPVLWDFDAYNRSKRP